MYRHFFKRLFDFLLSLMALIVLSPLFVILTITGRIVMKGNPFFFQERPGKDEKIFKLIKFRSMTEEKDKDGNLLPENQRLTKYGKILRSTSLDEIPELINIFKGDMSIVGPRPLLIKYLPYYSDREKLRHTVLPGLTGLAQISGRNNLGWDKRLELDAEYVENLSFINDIKIILGTVMKVIKREDIAEAGVYLMQDLDVERKGKN